MGMWGNGVNEWVYKYMSAWACGGTGLMIEWVYKYMSAYGHVG